MKRIAAIAVLALTYVSQAYAVVPVTDAASITTQVSNQIETMTKWAQQFQQMQQQINQARDQMKAITGARGMGSLLNNATLNSALPADWQSLMANARNLSTYASERSKYGQFPGYPKTNALYDTIAGQNATMTEIYRQSSIRLAQVNNLMGQIDSAADPAAKEDLANRLINEQNAIQANENLVTVLQAKQRQELEDARRQAADEYACKEFKSSGC